MATAFTDLGLSPALLAAVQEVGYEAPTAIQALTIPALLAGRDLIGQAQTGTGKTAAFALPILQRLDVDRAEVQAPRSGCCRSTGASRCSSRCGACGVGCRSSWARPGG